MWTRPSAVATGARTHLRDDLIKGCGYAYVTGMVVLIGVVLGQECLATSDHSDFFDPPGRTTDLESGLTGWDGKWYVRIARDGYSYDPKTMSSVAFYPVYPLLGRGLAWATGLTCGAGLVIVSNLCFTAALVLAMRYVRVRYPDGPPQLAEYTALALALFPVGFFFRMAYTESLFLLLSVLVLYALERRWPIAGVALIVGLATGVRASGVALIPPLAVAILSQRPSWAGRVLTAAWAVPLSCWGLVLFIAYQGWEFGEPFAFSQTQENWKFRPDDASTVDKAVALATLEPVWSVYDEGSPAHWRRFDKNLGPLFSLQFANPVYFAVAIGLVSLGAWKGWLKPTELLLSAGLLAVPYLSKSYHGCMASQARYAVITLPMYMVLGHVLVRVSPTTAVLPLAGCAFLLGAYSALFAGRYLFI